MSRLDALSRSKPVDDAPAADHAAWGFQVQTARDEAGVECAQAMKDQRDAASDLPQFKRLGKRIAELEQEQRDLRILLNVAEAAQSAAEVAQAARLEGERLAGLGAALGRRAAVLARADATRDQLVGNVREVEECDRDVLTYTLAADRRRTREVFARGHADFFPALIFALAGAECAVNMRGFSLQWPTTERTAKWSYRCGIRPPEPEADPDDELDPEPQAA
jgi:hypothetical protein